MKKTTRRAVTTYTLKDLYRATVGDAETPHQRTIDAHFRRLSARRRRIINLRLQAKSYGAIGAQLGISGASAQSVVRSAIENIRKAIAGEPRYNRRGRSSAEAV